MASGTRIGRSSKRSARWNSSGCRYQTIWAGAEFEKSGQYIRLAADEPLCGCLVLTNVSDRRAGGPSFVVGPVYLTIAPGEILFIVGGNGSGKSTLLRVLTGLYPAHKGVIRVNGAPVTGDRIVEYRALFSAVRSTCEAGPPP